ncbi:MAG: mannose-1-phosphate guanylyltransferase/mannose-6-phosphate isomerase, partial [Aquipseudomonas alcaligenes]
MIPVILSGGSGSRLWPLSRKLYPKQFLALTGEHSLFQQTLQRLSFEGMQKPVVVCNLEHRFIVNEQLAQIGLGAQAMLLEPFGRNTAPAVAMAALQLLGEGRDELMLILPADHVIDDELALRKALELARVAAEEGEMVLFGIPANSPETGFGYIKAARGEDGDDLVPGAYRVMQFVEKPDAMRAAEFVRSGGYYWNSGMFLFKAERFIEELERHAPDILKSTRAAVAAATPDLDFVRVDAVAFDACRSDSIDYAVMEKTQDAVVVPLAAGWSDVGSWSALHEA